MLKQFSLILLSTALIACGSDSSDSDNGIESEINPSLKGPEGVPALSVISGGLSDGSTIPVNTMVNGSIASGADLRYSFSVAEDQLLAIILDGEDNGSDVDLSVSDNQGFFVESTSLNSDEAVVLQAKAGIVYSLQLELFGSVGSDYSLTVVSGNRSSLQLGGNEYGITINRRETETCGSETDINEYTFVLAANFAKGYLRDLFDAEKVSADSASGNSLSFDISNTQEFDDGSYRSSLQLQLTVNPDTGVITGSGSSSSTETDMGTTESCTSTFTDTGRILL